MTISEITGTVNQTVVMGGPYDENLTVDANDPANQTDGVVAPTSGDGIDTVPTVDASDIFLNNLGSITGGSGAIGADFAYGISQLTNQGMIAGGASTTGAGGAGVEITRSNAGYGTNAGMIVGGDGATTGGAGLVLNAGASFNNGYTGAITGGNGTDGGDGGAGAVINDGFLEVQGGTVTGGTGTNGGAGVVVNDGSLEVLGGTVTGGTGTNGGAGVVMNGGTLSADGGTISGGTGTNGLGAGVLLKGGAILYDTATIYGGIKGDPTYGYAVDFGAGGGTLNIFGSSAVFEGSIGGFAAGDTINFYDATNVSVTGANSTSATISYTTSAGSETLTLAGNFSGEQLSVDSSTGMSSLTACYVRGTRIRTVQGDRAIESLTIGSTVLTASGEARRVRWLGHRTVKCSVHPNAADVWPVLMAAHAFADDVPARDVWMSPGHSILFEGSLIQASNLVNGVTVRQVPMDQVEYWHLELDSHDVILAEGLPAETYLDTGNRTAFENGGASLELHPRFEPQHWTATCHPLELDGPKVAQAREHLLKRVAQLGYRVVEDADVHLQVDGRRIEPTWLRDCRLVFALPEHAASIELRSRTFVPAHVDAHSRDDRALGLCVERLQVDGADVDLGDEAFFGTRWHQLESYSTGQRQRWTKGRTALPSGTRLVVIDLCGRGYYRVPFGVRTAEAAMAAASWR